MEKVTGIGGFFFRSRNPEALAAWYETHLGINGPGQSADDQPWRQEAGTTALAPFKQDTDYFGRPDKTWGINFRVRDLDRMVEQLRTAGIEVTVNPETYPMGRFATLKDPEGNFVELWQPDPPE